MSRDIYAECERDIQHAINVFKMMNHAPEHIEQVRDEKAHDHALDEKF